MNFIGRSPRGAPNSAQSPGRLTAGARPEFHDIRLPSDVSPSIATLAARTCSPLIQTTQRSGFCAALGVGNRPHTALIAGLNWFSPQLSRNFGLTSRHQPGSDSRRECPEWLPSVCLPHAQQHGEEHGQEAGKVSQGFGNV